MPTARSKAAMHQHITHNHVLADARLQPSSTLITSGPGKGEAAGGGKASNDHADSATPQLAF